MKHLRDIIIGFEHTSAWRRSSLLMCSCLGLLLLLAACGNVSTNQGTVAAAQRTSTPTRSSARELLPVAKGVPTFAIVSFTAATTYQSALRLVTNLGLQLQQPCQIAQTNPQGRIIGGLSWSAVGRKEFFKVTTSTSTQGTIGKTPTVTVERTLPALSVSVTPITPADWIARLKASSIVKSINTQAHFSCPNIGPVQPIGTIGSTPNQSLPTTSSKITSIAPQQAGTDLTVTFSASSSYDDALYIASNMGFRLAAPCYEQEAGKPADWYPMGQQQAFASTHTLTLATTDMSPTDWATRIVHTAGVTKANTAYKASC